MPGVERTFAAIVPPTSVSRSPSTTNGSTRSAITAAEPNATPLDQAVTTGGPDGVRRVDDQALSGEPTAARRPRRLTCHQHAAVLQQAPGADGVRAAVGLQRRDDARVGPEQ